MTSPLFYTAEVTGAIAEQVVSLDPAASGHAVRSQRLGTQDRVLVSDGVGTLATGVIVTADPQRTAILLESVTEVEPPAIQVNLVQALAKGDRDVLAAEMATEIGVDSVTPWQARRSIVRLKPDRVAKTLHKWEAKLQAAAQQARRAHIPQLHQPITAEQVADLHAPDRGHHVIVLHEDGQGDIAGMVGSVRTGDTLHIVVGPEGGVSAEELDAVITAGGVAVKIGSNVMRASTAGPVAIALLNQSFGRW